MKIALVVVTSFIAGLAVATWFSGSVRKDFWKTSWLSSSEMVATVPRCAVPAADNLPRSQTCETVSSFLVTAQPQPLPERFSQEVIQRNLRNAFQHQGIDGEVVTIDCIEYPCVIYGKIDGEKNWQKLEQAFAAGSPYADDHRTFRVWNYTVDKVPQPVQEMWFGLMLYPDDDSRGDEINQRFEFRVQQYWQNYITHVQAPADDAKIQ